MLKIDMNEFDQQRAKLASGLNACAEQLRNTAQIVEDFANLLGGLEGDKGKSKEHALLEDGDGTKKRKRNPKPKDPNAPKRPASSYILFQNEVRAELRKQNPNLSNPELLNLISEKWKSMSDEQKETYNQTMLRLKQEYSEAKNAYDNRSPEEVEAANKAAAEAAASKKANKGSRGKSNKESAVAAATPAPPPPEPESDDDDEDSEEEEEEEEELKPRRKPQYTTEEDESSDEEPKPAPKRKRAESVQPSKKSSKKSKS